MSDLSRENVLWSWLHLSDIHSGQGDAEHRANQELILDGLRDDLPLALRDANLPAVGAILVTGDVAFSGDTRETNKGVPPFEYERAREWLRVSAGKIGLGCEHVFLVPGNHDVQRAVDREDDIMRLRDVLRAGSERIDGALANPANRERLASRFANYLTFAETFAPACLIKPIEPRVKRLWWKYVFVTPSGLTVRLVGLNSALLAADNKDRGKLRLGEQQLSDTLRDRIDGEVVLVMTHHPFIGGWLTDESGADNWVRSRAHVHLCGHVHDPESQALLRGGATHGFVRIVAGAVHEERRRKRDPARHGYNVAAIVACADGRIRLRVWSRRWADKQKAFRLDLEDSRPGNQFAEHDLDIHLPAPKVMEHLVDGAAGQSGEGTPRTSTRVPTADDRPLFGKAMKGVGDASTAPSLCMEVELTPAGGGIDVRARGSGEAHAATHRIARTIEADVFRFSDGLRGAAERSLPLGAVSGLAHALHDAIFRDGVAALRARLRVAARGEPLLLRFLLTGAELHSVPWEALCEPGSETGFLANASDILPVRGVATTEAWRPCRVNGAMKVLPIAPEGRDSLTRIEDLLSRQSLSREIDPLPAIAGPVASEHLLFNQLQAQQPNVVHFLGIGSIRHGVPALRLADNGGTEVWIPAEIFAQLLAVSFKGDLRLVILEACRGSEPGALASAAEILTRSGADAVIAHLWPVRSDAARRSSDRFYKTLVGHEPSAGNVARSLNEARQAVLTSFKGSAEAFSPVLYLHAPQPTLVDFTATSTLDLSEPGTAALREGLCVLLGRLFSIPDLRRFLDTFPEGKDLLASVPGNVDDKAEWTSRTVDTLLRRRLLNENFFERLLSERGFRRSEIDEVRSRYASVIARPKHLPPLAEAVTPSVVPVARARRSSSPLSAGPWAHTTVRTALGAALRLDRSPQWAAVLEAYQRSEHVFFLLHGQSRQSLGLFVDRVHRFLTEESTTPHRVVRVPFKLGDSRATSGAEWGMHMAYALAPGCHGTAAEHLADAAKHKAVLLVLGEHPLHGLTPAQQDGLREVVCETLPQLLLTGRPAHPVRVLMAIDFDPGEESLEAKIDGWAEHQRVLRYCSLPEVKFPTWDEVEAYLRHLPRSERPDARTIELIRQEHEILRTADIATFQQLAERLDRHLEKS